MPTDANDVVVEIRIEFLGKSLRGRLFRSRRGPIEFVETNPQGEPLANGARFEITQSLFARYLDKISSELPLLP
jgi:hypothetical protein